MPPRLVASPAAVPKGMLREVHLLTRSFMPMFLKIGVFASHDA
jgi:hypothetical protein